PLLRQPAAGRACRVIGLALLARDDQPELFLDGLGDLRRRVEASQCLHDELLHVIREGGHRWSPASRRRQTQAARSMHVPQAAETAAAPTEGCAITAFAMALTAPVSGAP